MNAIKILTGSRTLILLMLFLVSGCGDGEGGPGNDAAEPALTTPIAVSLHWDPVSDSNVVGYVIHYGRESPQSFGSCAYEHAVYVPYHEGTVINLFPETRYYFAVSSYNGVESPCSSEVSTVTSPLPS